MHEIERLRSARAAILERIGEAAVRVGRDPGTVEIVAVTKTVAADRIRAAIDAGFTTLAENRVQERAEKAPAVGGGRWHLVGPLQSNKARRAVEVFDAVETVDSLDLAQRLSRIASEMRPGAPLPVLLQVNVDDDPAKAGFEPAGLDRDLPAILELPGITVDGLMTVGRLVETAELARPTFVALRALSERLRSRHAALGAALSMGMSEDYPIAVEEGATLGRLGRAIFGARPATG
jgi:pyridoxal phosphate enzyme (YggS family)